MRIGEFAKKNGVTVRALHHYEELGLIRPDRVDEFTGYRYYRPRQGVRLQLIAAMKQLGFSLSEIAELLDEPIPREDLLRILGDKLLGVRHEMNRALARRQGLEAFEAHVLTRPPGAPIDLKEVSQMTVNDIGKNLPGEGRADALYEEAWQRSDENQTPLSVLVMDVDHMLHVNEAWGREAGDEILDRVFNLAVRQSMDFHDRKLCDHSFAERGNSSNLHRKGGDEYIMVLEGADAESALALARKICDKIKGTDFTYAGCPEPVTVSIGVADRTHGPRSPWELIHLAETAMMDAKSGGRGRAMAYHP